LSLIVTGLAQWFLQPSGANPTAADAAAQFPVAWWAIGLTAVFGPLVWLAGIPAATSAGTGRGATVRLVGGLLTGAGLAAAVGHLALVFGLAADSPVGDVLLIVFLVGFSVGPIVLTVGMRMARVVAVWVPVAAVVTAVASFVGGPIAGVAEYAALALTWAPVAIAVARSARLNDRATPDALAASGRLGTLG
jgi:hypothetical protein